MVFAALPTWPNGKSRNSAGTEELNSTKSRRGRSRGGNPALPVLSQGFPAGLQPQSQILHTGRGVPVPQSCTESQGCSNPAVPGFPAVFQPAPGQREKSRGSHGCPFLTDTTSTSLKHLRLSWGRCWVASSWLQGARQQHSATERKPGHQNQELLFHPSLCAEESRENRAAQGDSTQEGSSRPCRGSLAAGRGGMDGESSQPPWVKLRAAELSSAEAEPALCSSGWVAKGSLDLPAEPSQGLGLSNKITHRSLPRHPPHPSPRNSQFLDVGPGWSFREPRQGYSVPSAMRLYFPWRCQVSKTKLSSTPRV